MAEFPTFRMNTILTLVKVLMWTAVLVYFISRLTNIKYSEYYCYGTMLLSIFVSMIILLSISAKGAESGGFPAIVRMMIKLFTSLLPGILLIAQLILLIVLFASYNDFIYSHKEMPSMFSIFNNLIFLFIILQLYLYQKYMNNRISVLEFNKIKGSEWTSVYVPAFVLASILGFSCTGELWVIISKFTTDG